MKCPACRQSTMFVVEHDGVELDVCAGCEGAWFDATELELLLGADPPLGAAGAAAAAEAGRPCPRCRRTMAKANIGGLGGVTVDVCSDNGCGLWFDRGELGAVCRGLEEGGHALDPAVGSFLALMFPDTPDNPAGEADQAPPARKGDGP
jgi:Zn-finger nucleic acid-binding protein